MQSHYFFMQSPGWNVFYDRFFKTSVLILISSSNRKFYWYITHENIPGSCNVPLRYKCSVSFSSRSVNILQICFLSVTLDPLLSHQSKIYSFKFIFSLWIIIKSFIILQSSVFKHSLAYFSYLFGRICINNFFFWRILSFHNFISKWKSEFVRICPSYS